MQERRKKYEENPRLAWDILEAGTARAREVASATMAEVRDAMGMSLRIRGFREHGEREVVTQRSRVAENLKFIPDESASPRRMGRGSPPSLGYSPGKRKKKKATSLSQSRCGDVYEGPLDLLLDLIRKQDIDIYDIPIARITAQYLAYVEKLRELDVNVAADFIYMAAVLIHIKSKMLLPRDPDAPSEAKTIRARNW